MAESAAPRARDADATMDQVSMALGAVPESGQAGRIHRMFGVAFSALLFGFLLLGTVTVGAGSWAGSRMSVRRIWARFTDFLVDEGGVAWAGSVTLAVALVALVGGVVLVFMAIGLRNIDISPHSDDSEPI